MSRPGKFDDLDDYAKTPHEFIKLDLGYLAANTAVGRDMLLLIDSVRGAEHRGDVVVSEDGEFVVAVPLTAAERTQRLKSAQQSYDYTREAYDAALSGSKLVPSWQRYSVDQWAKREGAEPIDWSAHDEAVQS